MPRKKEETVKVDVTIAAEIQKLDIKDGDLLVLKVRSEDVSPELLKAMRVQFGKQIEALGRNTKCIAFALPPPDDIEFSVVRAGEAAPADVQAALDQHNEESAAAGSTLDVGDA